MKDASPFLRPVDAVALNIPHYPQIIKNPMDFSTIERKLNSSNPAKPDPNTQNPRYHSADEFISDVRLIFQNCFTFNGPDHAISLMSKRIEEVFDKQIKQMPPTIEVDYFSITSDNAKHFFLSAKTRHEKGEGGYSTSASTSSCPCQKSTGTANIDFCTCHSSIRTREQQ